MLDTANILSDSTIISRQQSARFPCIPDGCWSDNKGPPWREGVFAAFGQLWRFMWRLNVTVTCRCQVARGNVT